MRKIAFAVFVSVLFFATAVSVYATSGCCSWHDGVSHCDTSTGRQVCNDGSYSPSCTCQYIPPKPKKQTTPEKPAPTIGNIQKEIDSVKSKYWNNHEGFRERLIDQIVNYLNADKIQVATEVYMSLPDVK